MLYLCNCKHDSSPLRSYKIMSDHKLHQNKNTTDIQTVTRLLLRLTPSRNASQADSQGHPGRQQTSSKERLTAKTNRRSFITTNKY